MSSIVRALFRERVAPGEALAGQSEPISLACRDLAERFRGGGKLVVFGTGPAAADANHVAVEFVHPVLVGKVALPALSIGESLASAPGGDPAAALATEITLLVGSGDALLGIGADGAVETLRAGLGAGRKAGALTMALLGGSDPEVSEADHVLRAPSDDPLVIKELQVTLYHVLWELTHVFLERAGSTRAAG